MMRIDHKTRMMMVTTGKENGSALKKEAELAANLPAYITNSIPRLMVSMIGGI